MHGTYVYIHAHAHTAPGDAQPTLADEGEPPRCRRIHRNRGSGWELICLGVGCWPLGIPHFPADLTWPWEPQIPLGGVRQHRRSQSRGEQTNTLYSIITTVRIIVSRGSCRARASRVTPSRWAQIGSSLPLG